MPNWRDRFVADLRVSALAWAVYGLLHLVLLRAADTSSLPVPLGSAAALAVVHATTWILLSPTIAALHRALAGRYRQRVVLGIHVAAAWVCAAIVGLLRGELGVWLGIRAAQKPLTHILFFIDVELASYAAVVLATVVVARLAALVEVERSALSARERLATARRLFLTGQLRPHFLFNCLNGVAQLVHEQPARAIEVMRRLQLLLSASAAASERTLIPFEEELAFVHAYVDIERARFGEHLSVSISASSAALRAAVPPLLLQPLIENAVRHGQRADGTVGEISLAAEVRGVELCLTVTNLASDAWSELPRGLGVGSRNVERRLQETFGARARLVFAQNPRRETAVSIWMPYAEAEAPPVLTPPADIVLTHTAPTLTAEDAGAAQTWSEHSSSPTTAIADGTSSMDWRRGLKLAGAIGAGWVALSFFWGAQMHLFRVSRGILNVPIFEATRGDLTSAALWALFAPLVFLASRAFPLVGRRRALRIAIHAAAASLVSVFHIEILRRLGFFGEWPLVSSLSINQLLLNVLTYWLVLMWANGRALAGAFRDRLVSAESLSSAAADAHWRGVAVNLPTALLSSALDGVVGRVMSSASEAELEVLSLADDLRFLLALSEQTSVSLADEVMALRSWLHLRRLAGLSSPVLEYAACERDGVVTVPNGALRSVIEAALDAVPRGNVDPQRLTVSGPHDTTINAVYVDVVGADGLPFGTDAAMVSAESHSAAQFMRAVGASARWHVPGRVEIRLPERVAGHADSSIVRKVA